MLQFLEVKNIEQLLPDYYTKKPEVLVLDQATSSSLDSTLKNYIQMTVQRLRAENKTIIIIEHSLIL